MHRCACFKSFLVFGRFGCHVLWLSQAKKKEDSSDDEMPQGYVEVEDGDEEEEKEQKKEMRRKEKEMEMRKEKETQVGRKEKEKEKAKEKEKEEKQEEKLNLVMFLGFCILTSMQRETCLALFAVLFF